MKIGIPREIREGERRVALTPPLAGDLKKFDAEVLLQSGAGEGAFFKDEQYEKAGARIVKDASALYKESDIIMKVQPPMQNDAAGVHEAELLNEGGTIVGFMAPLNNRDMMDKLLARRITVFSMEFIPRITRAQSMDALSSMSTVAGYKAVLLATEHFGKFFPLLMTAAGTIPPATVLVLGAGVAGLQAIATARRLGARVEAFDTRPAVREQVESIGARFVEMEMPEDSETKGGYAKEMTEEFIKKEMEAIGARLPKSDIVITTAQVFGKKAPLLITADMVKLMRPGSVIVDLAAEQEGNCELTREGEVVREHGVTIMGPVNVPSMMPVHASQMLGRNMVTLLKHLYSTEDKKLDFTDEITKGSCLCHNGELVNEFLKKAFSEGGS
ncbi:Re/Si-specific NAD(P)(+) transhydrogenase subunit alpha [Acidobacteriota bacterium]